MPIDPLLLKKIFILQDLEEEELQQVLQACVHRDFPAQTNIMEEGEPGDAMYIMVEGMVQITKRLILEVDENAPKEKVMIRLRAEDGIIFGEMALIENDVRSATVTTESPCTLLELSGNNFFHLVHEHPVMGVKILLRLGQFLSQRLRKSNEDIIKLTTALAIALE